MILGITGSIACGKTIVCDYIKQKGYKVINLDEISHALFDQKEINDRIKSAFDIEMNELVDRKTIANIVFSDKEKLKELNNILHPLIIDKMKEEIDKARKDKENLFIEVPLLYEEGLDDYFDNCVLIYVSKEIQIKRLMERNDFNNEEALIRINSQMDIEEKLKKALKQNHFLIDNNKDLDYTYKAIDKLLDIINKNNN